MLMFDTGMSIHQYNYMSIKLLQIVGHSTKPSKIRNLWHGMQVFGGKPSANPQRIVLVVVLVILAKDI